MKCELRFLELRFVEIGESVGLIFPRGSRKLAGSLVVRNSSGDEKYITLLDKPSGVFRISNRYSPYPEMMRGDRYPNNHRGELNFTAEEYPEVFKWAAENLFAASGETISWMEIPERQRGDRFNHYLGTFKALELQEADRKAEESRPRLHA